MRKFGFHSIWRKKRDKDRYIAFHSHNYYELVYYPYGNGVTKLGDVTFHFGPHTFIIIPPNINHDELHLSDSEVICLGFSLAHDLPKLFLTDDSMVIHKILKEILKEATDQAFDYREMITAKLNELYIQILRIRNPKATAAKNFEHIINYITENYHEKIQLSTFAEQLNISYDYFQHKFKQLTGYSPQNFLLSVRLQAAKDLLLRKNLSCTEITYRCGFSTPAQFSMLFKKEYGISPQNYRARHAKAARLP